MKNLFLTNCLNRCNLFSHKKPTCPTKSWWLLGDLLVDLKSVCVIGAGKYYCQYGLWFQNVRYQTESMSAIKWIYKNNTSFYQFDNGRICWRYIHVDDREKTITCRTIMKKGIWLVKNECTIYTSAGVIGGRNWRNLSAAHPPPPCGERRARKCLTKTLKIKKRSDVKMNVKYWIFAPFRISVSYLTAAYTKEARNLQYVQYKIIRKFF